MPAHWRLIVALCFLTSAAYAQNSSAPDIMKQQDFLSKHPQFAPMIRSIVIAAGFECPAVIGMWYRGETQYGTALEVLCGPDDGSKSAYDAQHYAVYPQHIKVTVCAKFSAAQDCP